MHMHCDVMLLQQLPIATGTAVSGSRVSLPRKAEAKHTARRNSRCVVRADRVQLDTKERPWADGGKRCEEFWCS
jgi:hypothetical protein